MIFNQVTAVINRQRGNQLNRFFHLKYFQISVNVFFFFCGIRWFVLYWFVLFLRFFLKGGFATLFLSLREPYWRASFCRSSFKSNSYQAFFVHSAYVLVPTFFLVSSISRRLSHYILLWSAHSWSCRRVVCLWSFLMFSYWQFLANSVLFMSARVPMLCVIIDLTQVLYIYTLLSMSIYYLSKWHHLGIQTPPSLYKLELTVLLGGYSSFRESEYIHT